MHKFLSMIENSAVGRDGFVLQICVLLDNTATPDMSANKTTKEALSHWTERGVCGVTDQLSFTDSQQLLIRGVARDGEVLACHLSGFSNEYSYTLQVLDINRLDVGYDVPPQNGHNAAHMDVGLNSYSRPVAYWLRTLHPGETYGQTSTGNLYERVPAGQISHILLHDCPEQWHGFPWVASATIGLQSLLGYQEAAIIAARVGASKMGFFKQTEDTDNFIPPIDRQEVDNGRGDIDLIDSVESDTLHELPQGYDFTPLDPDCPYVSHDTFVKVSLHGITSGLNVAYHSLASDLEGVNLPNIRSGTPEERDTWMTL